MINEELAIKIALKIHEDELMLIIIALRVSLIVNVVFAGLIICCLGGI